MRQEQRRAGSSFVFLMDQYKLLQRLGKGGQGSVFLVKHKSENKEYVLKKLECNDEIEADRAFKEAMALNELRHRFICGYKEFFVMWDKQESAMFVCIVMEYYKMGDLSRFLMKQRNKNEVVDTLLLKKWLGQMLAGLVFVHDKRIIHRDLKPSNIFLTEDMDVCLGDFGVATIMADLRTQTRTTVGSMNWMAPEVVNKSYDERSDIWSLGCVLLEIAACGILDAKSVSDALSKLKEDVQVIDGILDKVSACHGHEITCLILQMIEKDYHKRPSAMELCKTSPLVQDCLNLIQSKMTTGCQSEEFKMPENMCAEEIFGYIAEHQASAEHVKQGFLALAKLRASDDASVNVGGVQLIIRSLRSWSTRVDVLVAGLHLLAVLPSAIQCSDDAISLTISSMKGHPDLEVLQTAATKLLMSLSSDENASEKIGELGGVQDLLAAFSRYPQSQDIAISCCTAVWGLCINERNAKVVTEEQGVIHVCNALRNHLSNSYLVEVALLAIWCLSIDDENVSLMVEWGIIQMILRAVKEHSSDSTVLKNACTALASLAEADETSAYELLDNQNEKDSGIDILTDGLRHHGDSEDVVENFSLLISELANYDDICNDLKSRQIGTVLAEAKIRFPSNTDLALAINDALVSLGHMQQSKRTCSARSRPRSAKPTAKV